MGMVVSLHPPRKKQRFLPKNNDVCDVLDGGWFLSQEAARCKLVGKPQWIGMKALDRPKNMEKQIV